MSRSMGSHPSEAIIGSMSSAFVLASFPALLALSFAAVPTSLVIVSGSATLEQSYGRIPTEGATQTARRRLRQTGPPGRGSSPTVRIAASAGTPAPFRPGRVHPGGERQPVAGVDRQAAAQLEPLL